MPVARRRDDSHAGLRGVRKAADLCHSGLGGRGGEGVAGRGGALGGWVRGAVGEWEEFPGMMGRMYGCVEGSGGEGGVGGGVGSAKNA